VGEPQPEQERGPEQEREPEDEGVTNVVERVPRPGQAAALEQAIKTLIGAAMHFPGHQGVTVTRPAPPGQPGFRIVYRFDTAAHMQAWLGSEVYARLAAAADRFTEGEAHQELVAGLETWFTPPGSAAPSRLRVTLMTWVGITPLVFVYGKLLAWALPAATPAIVRAALITALAVPTMAFCVGPVLTRLCRPWLYPKRDRPPVS
jgi:antibiotic biosynthesis monooxygenase (ABM) superfamily enzyme